MIRQCDNNDFAVIYTIINDAAQVYKGTIPEDCWKTPYMSKEELAHEIAEGIIFWGYEEGGNLIGVMGSQPVQDVVLIRHAYVRTNRQNQGLGSRMLSELLSQINRPVLIGTWADAFWAIRFYKKHGFQLVRPKEKDRLLRKYWSIPERQIETSVVLADQRWFSADL
ncbi:MAG: GNAT family N-acetyltransferase [Desulfobacteraceae bacterium 4484_190.1]|nr:MAG: GNAT family N-acetyltransferase [Desulfobacteraceae bacterium 4484_190.1]RLB13882.1 MAG: GNAT family N-acetyltransferase [Deltaproteobacteria bacterium]